MKKLLNLLLCLLTTIAAFDLYAGKVADYAGSRYPGCSYDDTLTASQIIQKTGENTIESSSDGSKYAAAYDPTQDKIYICKEYNDLYADTEKIKQEISDAEKTLTAQRESLDSTSKKVEEQKKYIERKNQEIKSVEQTIRDLKETPDAENRRFTIDDGIKKSQMTYAETLAYYEKGKSELLYHKKQAEDNLKKLESNYEVQENEIEKTQAAIDYRNDLLKKCEKQLQQLDATIQHELAHQRVSKNLKSLQGSILDEGYACLVSEANGDTIEPGTTRYKNLEMFKSLLDSWGYPHTPEGTYNALVKAQSYIEKGKSAGELGNTKWGNASDADMTKTYNYLIQEFGKKEEEAEKKREEEKQKEIEVLLPPDTTVPNPPQNGNDGQTNTFGNASGASQWTNPGKAYIDGKIGSQTGTWNNFK